MQPTLFSLGQGNPSLQARVFLATLKKLLTTSDVKSVARRPWLIPALLCAQALVQHAQARADVNQCVVNAEKGQELRQSGALLDAQRALRACAADQCPALIRKDCSLWLHQIDEELPSLILAVTDAGGQDVTVESLIIDELLQPLGSVALPIHLDPGQRKVSVVVQRQRYERTVILRSGERNRVLAFTTAIAPLSPLTKPEGRPRSNVVSWALLGASGVAFASFAYLGITGSQRAEALRNSCAPDCTDSQVNSARHRLWGADAALAIGLTTGAIATWLQLRPDPASPVEQRSAQGLSVRFGRAAATLSWRGQF